MIFYNLLFHPGFYFQVNKNTGWKRPISIFVITEILLTIINYSPAFFLPGMKGISEYSLSPYSFILNITSIAIGFLIIGLIFHFFIKIAHGKSTISKTYQVLMSARIPLIFSHICSVVLFFLLVNYHIPMNNMVFSNIVIHLLMDLWVLIITINGICINQDIPMNYAMLSVTIPFLFIIILQLGDSGHLLSIGLHPLDYYLKFTEGIPIAEYMSVIITKIIHLF